jgi:deoxyribose-phosphate aldolase
VTDPSPIEDVEAMMRAIRCMDLTSLEGTETPEAIVALCAKAERPAPGVPSVAAVCLFPAFVPVAVERLRGTGVAVAAVAGGFPTGLGPLETRLEEISGAVHAGADEIDIVLNRSLFLGAREAEAREELLAAREAAGPALLKVILETGELGSLDQVRRAATLAMEADADFIKTSTGKVGVGATLPAALCMMEAIRDVRERSGREVGIKVAGGIRTPEQAMTYLEAVRATLGTGWLRPERFRIGASSLLDAVLSRLS